MELQFGGRRPSRVQMFSCSDVWRCWWDSLGVNLTTLTDRPRYDLIRKPPTKEDSIEPRNGHRKTRLGMMPVAHRVWEPSSVHWKLFMAQQMTKSATSRKSFSDTIYVYSTRDVHTLQRPYKNTTAGWKALRPMASDESTNGSQTNAGTAAFKTFFSIIYHISTLTMNPVD